MTKHNPVSWFEIPVIDMDRAVKFYEFVFNIKLEKKVMGELEMAWFPMFDESIGATGSLMKNKNYIPSKDGVKIYFTSPSGNLDEDLKKVIEAGGSIGKDKTLINEDIGYIASFVDSEGNKICLHSRI